MIQAGDLETRYTRGILVLEPFETGCDELSQQIGALMRFYDCATAPSPRRVRIFLAEKGLTVPTVQVDLQRSAPTWLCASYGCRDRAP